MTASRYEQETRTSTIPRSRNRDPIPRSRRRMRPGGGHHSHESRVFDACSRLPDAPGGLERAGDAPRSARPSEIAFGSLRAVCESLADATTARLAPDTTALEPDRLQQLRRPLFIVDQSLRLTASACNLGREVVASVQGHR